MRRFLCSNKWRRYAARVTGVVIFVSCLIYVTSCLPAADPAFNAIKQVLIEDKDPDAIYRALEANLDKVKEKQIVEVLLNYLRQQRQRQVIDTGNVRQAALYLERISGLKHRMKPMALIGLTYMTTRDWDKDISQWQDWWDANKDYIYWDEQAQALKVKPH